MIDRRADGDVQRQRPRPSVDLDFDGTAFGEIVGSARDQLRSIEGYDFWDLAFSDQRRHLASNLTM